MFLYACPLPAVGKVWTALSWGCGVLLSLHWKALVLEPELLCAYTELSSPAGWAGCFRRSSLSVLVRNSFCLVQPGSSVHLAAVLQACKGLLGF